MKLKEITYSYTFNLSKTCWNAYSRCQTFEWRCTTPHYWKNTWKHWEDRLGNSLTTPLPALTSHRLTSTCLESWKNSCQENVLPLIKKLENETRNWLTNFYAEYILKLLSRWEKCLNLFGDYVEK
jgi:hypothetical protein